MDIESFVKKFPMELAAIIKQNSPALLHPNLNGCQLRKGKASGVSASINWEKRIELVTKKDGNKGSCSH